MTRPSSRASVGRDVEPTSGACAGYRDLTEARTRLGTSIVRGDRNECGPGREAPADRRRRHVPVSSAAARDLSPVQCPDRAGLEPARPAEDGEARPSVSSAWRVSVRPALVYRRPRRSTRSTRSIRRSSTTAGSVFLTFWPSEFSQIRGQYRRTRATARRHGRTSSCCNSVLDRRPRRARVLPAGAQTLNSGNRCMIIDIHIFALFACWRCGPLR